VNAIEAGVLYVNRLEGDNDVLAIKSKMRLIRGYRELLLSCAMIFNSHDIACVSAENRRATMVSDIDRIPNATSFDAEKFGLSGCDNTLLRDMKHKNVVPKSVRYNERIPAYKYQNADATIFIPKKVNPHNTTGFVLFSSIVTNLKAYDFTKPFQGKTLSEVEGFLASHLDGSKFEYKIDPSRKIITLSTEGTDIEFYSNKDETYRIDFHCDSHD